MSAGSGITSLSIAPSPEIVQDVTIAPNGNPIATGYFYGTGTYGGAPLTSGGLSDGFLVSLAP